MYKSIHLQAGIIHLVLPVLRFRLNLSTGNGLLKNEQLKNEYDK